MEIQPYLLVISLIGNVIFFHVWPSTGSTSAVGDTGMKRDGLRVAFEAWNFCNEVGQETPGMGSPRAADCFDLSSSTTTYANAYSKGLRNRKSQSRRQQQSRNESNAPFTVVELQHKVSEEQNKLGVGTSFPGQSPDALNNSDLYAAEKELYLGSLCQVNDTPSAWHFWMVMLKNGNLDTTAGLCPANGRTVSPFPPNPKRFPCSGPGCMNQPILKHRKTELVGNGTSMTGAFYGTYDLGRAEDIGGGAILEQQGVSYYEVLWEKEVGEGSWAFKHKLKTSDRYPWLMLYLRADATSGFSGGYPYETRGMLKILPESPHFKVRIHLDVKRGGGPKSQFYLIDMGSCWKNNGKPCDGDVLTDVTRYSEMIINPETTAWCSATNLRACPPYHISSSDTLIYRNDTAHFPYKAYHYYCGPGNAMHLDNNDPCDPYSNPQAQEIVQLLPHPIWEVYGFPTSPGQGWIGDPRTWELDVGGLSGRLYFYQDPSTPPAKRVWMSLDMGTEIFVSDREELAEWTVSDFDVIITS